MEGLYLRAKSNGIVTRRAKDVRPEFVKKIKQSTHWQQQTMVPNQLCEGVKVLIASHRNISVILTDIANIVGNCFP